MVLSVLFVDPHDHVADGELPPRNIGREYGTKLSLAWGEKIKIQNFESLL